LGEKSGKTDFLSAISLLKLTSAGFSGGLKASRTLVCVQCDVVSGAGFLPVQESGGVVVVELALGVRFPYRKMRERNDPARRRVV
jgi:hypothetical protein